MRTNAVPAHRLGNGWNYGHTPNAKRVATVLDTPIFELLREQAAARGVGLSTIARELIEDGLARTVER